MRTVIMAGFLAVLALATGCEKTTTSKALDVTTTPADAKIDVRGSVTLKAAIPEAERETRTIFYPLEWTVSDSSLGTVREAAGDSAVYVANDSEGVNTVTVRDQAGAEGIASITQAIPEEDATPEETIE